MFNDDDGGLSKFVVDVGPLLQLENEAERQEQISWIGGISTTGIPKALSHFKSLEKSGIALTKLPLLSSRLGLYGKTLFTFGYPKNGFQKQLPATTITTGDNLLIINHDYHHLEDERVVEKKEKKEDEADSYQLEGIVVQVGLDYVQVGCQMESPRWELGDGITLVKLNSDITYKRLQSALQNLQTLTRVHGNLPNLLFGESTLSPPHHHLDPKIIDPLTNEIKWVNKDLDESQKEAVKFTLLQKEAAIVHGPPGTGKTTTLVEIILQSARCGNKILVTAPSNVAVDNLLDRLVNRWKMKRIVRLGNPARVNEHLQKFSLDAFIDHSEQSAIVRDIRKEIDAILRGEYCKKGELTRLRKECRQRENKAIEEILKGADVILSTITSATPTHGPLKYLPEKYFDMTVIDECSQALEIACWMVLPQAPKTVLGGDHLQLPPTIKSEKAAKDGLEVTLMERVIKMDPTLVKLLTTQYRMNEKISNWSSKTFYENKLMAHESVKHHLLKDLKFINSNNSNDENIGIPLLLIDTTGCEMYELMSDDEISKANEGEVSLVTIHVEELIKSGLNPSEIAVITPYNLQVELIRLQLREKYPTLEIRSVDGFQGREKEAVVLSLVRSNPNGQVGFLSESRRLNVAVTRARRHVAVICNSETVSHDKFLQEFITYMETQGEVRTAHQYQHLIKDIIRPEGLQLTIQDVKLSTTQTTTTNTSKKSTTKSINNKSSKKSKSSREDIKPKNSNTSEEGKRNLEEINHENDDDTHKNLRKGEFEKTLEKFIESKNESTYNFSSKLNSHDRMLVHEIAEKYDLIHQSVGEGKSRYIMVKKKSTQFINNNSGSKIETQDSTSSPKSLDTCEKDNDLNLVFCCNCLHEIPKINIELHKLRCSSNTSAISNQESHDKKKTKKKQKKKNDNNGDDDNFDAICESFSKLDCICNYDKCKEKISILGVTCKFCAVRFCLNHSMPEIHGCGADAKRSARQQISRDGQLYAGSGRPNFKPDPTKRAQLLKKLDKKIGDKESERKIKKEEK